MSWWSWVGRLTSAIFSPHVDLGEVVLAHAIVPQ